MFARAATEQLNNLQDNKMRLHIARNFWNKAIFVKGMGYITITEDEFNLLQSIGYTFKWRQN